MKRETGEFRQHREQEEIQIRQEGYSRSSQTYLGSGRSASASTNEVGKTIVADRIHNGSICGG